MKITLKHLRNTGRDLNHCVALNGQSLADITDPAGDSETIHALRVTCKRMRAYLRLVRPHMKKNAYRRENRLLRDINRSLAGIRDADVVADTLMLVCQNGDPPLPKASVAAIRRKLLAHHADPPDSLELTARALQDLQRFSDAFPRLYHSKAGGWALLREGFHQTFHLTESSYHETLKSRKPEDFHEWRKILKYLRFQVQLLLDVEPLIMPGMYNTLIDLERALGHHHDLHLLARHLNSLKANPGRKNETLEKIVYAVGRESERCEKKILQSGRRLFVSEGTDLLTILDEQLK